MQKLRRRMGIAAILALPIALGASLVTNLEDSNSSVVSNDEMTLSHTDGVNDHEDDGNEWISLTAEYVDSTQDGKSEGEVPGSTETDGMTYYYLNDDLELDSYDITITGNVTLCLNGNILYGTGSDSVITVSTGATLALHDCKYENEDYPHDYYLDTSNYNISVFGDESNTEWLSEYNAALANNSENVGTVYGGVITGGRNFDNGGGIYASGGTFIMEGGTIAGNISYYFGGGVYVYDAIFTLNNGTISNNTALYSGGAVRMRDGTFVMNGGVIKNNIASINYGGGVYLNVDSDFTLNNGVISGNTANYGGGGIYFADNGTFTMYNGIISGNTAESGGGVYAKYFYMHNGTISENTSEVAGGVFVVDGEFIMYNGDISNNTTSIYNLSPGGGVYVSACEFTMHNGTISENTSNNGGGVYVITANLPCITVIYQIILQGIMEAVCI